MRKFLNDENGFVVSAELMLVMTLMFCAAAVGWGAVKDSLANELNDVSHAIGSVDQSFQIVGISKPKISGSKPHGSCAGYGYNDASDDCDCQVIVYDDACGKTDPSLLVTAANEDGSPNPPVAGP